MLTRYGLNPETLVCSWHIAERWTPDPTERQPAARRVLVLLGVHQMRHIKENGPSGSAISMCTKPVALPKEIRGDFRGRSKAAKCLLRTRENHGLSDGRVDKVPYHSVVTRRHLGVDIKDATKREVERFLAGLSEPSVTDWRGDGYRAVLKGRY